MIVLVIEFAALGKAGEELTYRIRTKTFRSILRQDMTFFDQSENTVGQLTNQLSADGNAIKDRVGNRSAHLVKNRKNKLS